MLRRLGAVPVVVAGLVLTPLTSTPANAVPTQADGGTTVTQATVTTAAADCKYTPTSVALKGRPKALKFSVPDAADWNVRIPDAKVDAAPGRRVKTFYAKDFKNSDAGLHQPRWSAARRAAPARSG